MKFGIFYELQLPKPWEPRRRVSSCSSDALDQIELADRLGYDYAWEVEHHFLEEYSHSLGARGVPRAPRASAPRTSASATASSSSRRTIRRGSPSGCRTLDL